MRVSGGALVEITMCAFDNCVSSGNFGGGGIYVISIPGLTTTIDLYATSFNDNDSGVFSGADITCFSGLVTIHDDECGLVGYEGPTHGSSVDSWKKTGDVVGTASSFSCACPANFMGFNCETAIRCAAGADGNPCMNGGFASGTLDADDCSCDCSSVNFHGEYCETGIACIVGAGGNLCKNGGVASGTGNDCSCDCSSVNFHGDNF